ALDVLTLDVLQEPPPPSHHLEQTPPGRMVLLVGLQVLGELGDPLRQYRDLHIGRSRIAAGEGVLLDDLVLGFFGQRHGCRSRLPAPSSSRPRSTPPPIAVAARTASSRWARRARRSSTRPDAAASRLRPSRARRARIALPTA